MNDSRLKISLELPPSVHRDLLAYADVLARTTGQTITDPAKLIGPMIERFMATDRVFARARRGAASRPA
jgi:hypothetical protein